MSHAIALGIRSLERMYKVQFNESSVPAVILERFNLRPTSDSNALV